MTTFEIILLSLIGIIAIGSIVYAIVKMSKMTKDEKKETIKRFVSGAVVLAEKELGSGKGAEKLQMVENYFNEKAPKFYKFLLILVGKDNLKDIIEEALSEIKENFYKN